MTYNYEERIGVHSIAKIFEEELRWKFREQSISDHGIDAYVEITRAGFKTGSVTPTGKLLAVQIKSGQSFLKEMKDDYFVYRGLKRHLDYWLKHCVPTILIIYDKITGNAYWRELNKSTIILTNKGFKINIFKQNLLNLSNKEALTNIAFFSNKYHYKLWQIQSSIDEIKLLMTTPLFLYIEIDEIVGSNSCNVTLLVTDDGYTSFPELIYTGGNDNANRFEYRFELSKDSSLQQAISDTIPWADFLFGDEYFTDEILATTIADELLSFNQEELSNDVSELIKHNIFFHLVCYLTGSYCFRLDLKANKLTYAFLEMEAFLEKEPIVRTRVYY